MGWGSAWLESGLRVKAKDLEPSAAGCDEQEQQQASSMASRGPACGPSWLSVVKGIRRSMDVHLLKSYFKIDNAFAASLRQTNARARIDALTSGLVDTGLVDFAGVCLVNPPKRTFGVASLFGPGAELFPQCLSRSKGAKQLQRQRTRLSFFTRSVFAIDGSNWSVEDVTNSCAPWYYDCTDMVYGLPKEAAWLQRAGMRSVLALPCIYDGAVHGVLLVATRLKTVDHLLLRKLEELCYSVTPFMVDALTELQPTLSDDKIVQRFESVTDFAHSLLWEMQTLDRKVHTNLQRSCAHPALAAHNLDLEVARVELEASLDLAVAEARSAPAAVAASAAVPGAEGVVGAKDCSPVVYIDAASPSSTMAGSQQRVSVQAMRPQQAAGGRHTELGYMQGLALSQERQRSFNLSMFQGAGLPPAPSTGSAGQPTMALTPGQQQRSEQPCSSRMPQLRPFQCEQVEEEPEHMSATDEQELEHTSPSLVCQRDASTDLAAMFSLVRPGAGASKAIKSTSIHGMASVSLQAPQERHCPSTERRNTTAAAPAGDTSAPQLKPPAAVDSASASRSLPSMCDNIASQSRLYHSTATDHTGVLTSTAGATGSLVSPSLTASHLLLDRSSTAPRVEAASASASAATDRAVSGSTTRLANHGLASPFLVPLTPSEDLRRECLVASFAAMAYNQADEQAEQQRQQQLVGDEGVSGMPCPSCDSMLADGPAGLQDCDFMTDAGASSTVGSMRGDLTSRGVMHAGGFSYRSQLDMSYASFNPLTRGAPIASSLDTAILQSHAGSVSDQAHCMSMSMSMASASAAAAAAAAASVSGLGSRVGALSGLYQSYWGSGHATDTNNMNRWSKDSAVAAAAMWGNEAAEAVSAAAKWSAGQSCLGIAHPSAHEHHHYQQLHPGNTLHCQHRHPHLNQSTWPGFVVGGPNCDVHDQQHQQQLQEQQWRCAGSPAAAAAGQPAEAHMVLQAERRMLVQLRGTIAQTPARAMSARCQHEHEAGNGGQWPQLQGHGQEGLLINGQRASPLETSCTPLLTQVQEPSQLQQPHQQPGSAWVHLRPPASASTAPAVHQHGRDGQAAAVDEASAKPGSGRRHTRNGGKAQAQGSGRYSSDEESNNARKGAKAVPGIAETFATIGGCGGALQRQASSSELLLDTLTSRTDSKRGGHGGGSRAWDGTETCMMSSGLGSNITGATSTVMPCATPSANTPVGPTTSSKRLAVATATAPTTPHTPGTARTPLRSVATDTLAAAAAAMFGFTRLRGNHQAPT